MDLSVILVSYNTASITKECLHRLKVAVEHTKSEFHNKIDVIVVDNGSTDGSVEAITTEYPWVQLIQSGKNGGYGFGNNIGMKKSIADYLLLLNTDAYINEDTLTKSLMFFKNHPECSVLGCKLTFKDGSFQPSGGFLPSISNVTTWMLMLDKVGLESKPVHPNKPSFFSSTREVGWVMGAYFMIKKEVFTQTGGFDEAMFMYMEEVEWCMRLQQKGYRVFFTPEFQAIHLGSASSNFNVAAPLAKEMEGLKYVFRKHYPDKVGTLKLLIVLGCLIRIALFTPLLKFNRVGAYLKVLANISK